jgi:hypothetical protein
MKKETHKELIICPECENRQWAIVEHTEPFYTYIHNCPVCKYVITESDWNVVKAPTTKLN